MFGKKLKVWLGHVRLKMPNESLFQASFISLFAGPGFLLFDTDDPLRRLPAPSTLAVAAPGCKWREQLTPPGPLACHSPLCCLGSWLPGGCCWRGSVMLSGSVELMFHGGNWGEPEEKSSPSSYPMVRWPSSYHKHSEDSETMQTAVPWL